MQVHNGEVGDRRRVRIEGGVAAGDDHSCVTGDDRVSVTVCAEGCGRVNAWQGCCRQVESDIWIVLHIVHLYNVWVGGVRRVISRRRLMHACD